MYTLQESVTAQTGETNPIALYPTPGVSLGAAEIDPTSSLILPAGVSYTSASGDLIGVAPVPLPSSVLMLSFGLALLALIPRRKILAAQAGPTHAGKPSGLAEHTASDTGLVVMLVEQLPHFGQTPVRVGGVTIGAGLGNQSKLALQPLGLTRGELRAVGRVHAHLPDLVRMQ
jgi:hypothetical protein